ncbi:LacI family transcriptional regulator [Cohaesibacter celericrescens]|nr:LacI family transcriptional regulator [Cohaesibacter celericrescens]
MIKLSLFEDTGAWDYQEQDPMAEGYNRPTQKTIAELTGLAVTTVSRALQGDPKIAVKTRETVAQVADDIGYVPDRAAQRLRTGKTRVISLILNPHDELLGFGNSMISGLSESIEGSDYHLTITPSFSDIDDVGAIKRLVRNGLADGLVLTRTRNFDDRIRFLLEAKFPFICHGRTDFSRDHNFVDFDNEAFAYIAAKRLAQKGCKKLAIILPKDIFTFHQHMQYGFMKAVRETGLAYVIPKDVTLDSSPDEIKAWVAGLYENGQEEHVDGFVCPGEASYLALLSALRGQGLSRGQDYDVVVKANSAILEQIDPELDRVFEDIRDAGKLLGQNLLSVLKGEGGAVRQIVQSPLTKFE